MTFLDRARVALMLGFLLPKVGSDNSRRVYARQAYTRFLRR